MLWLCPMSEEAMTDLVQKIRDVLVAIKGGTMFRLDFDLMSPHLLSEAADEIERLKAAPLRLQADRLMLAVEHLEKDLASMKDLYDRTYKVNGELNDIIATLDEALEPLTYMDCESWGCVHDEEPCAIEQAKKARACVGGYHVR